MWKYIVRFILRSRLAILITILLVTVFMAYKAADVEISYELAQMLPKTDSTHIEYQNFKKTFGTDGSVMFIGVKHPDLYKLPLFNDWHDLTYEILETSGVEQVLSLGRIYHLKKNDSLRKFDFEPVTSQKPRSQKELDSIKSIIFSQPLFENMLFNPSNQSTIMMVTLDRELLNDAKRVALIDDIEKKADAFGQQHDITVHYSGLPYIRTITSEKIKNELNFFIILAILIASVALFLFFRSVKAVIFPMLVVIISVTWVMGTIVLLGYKITILTGILPPLLIIIGVENAIFLLNKYHYEYRIHGNKIKALSRMVQRVGNATFLTNLTTAVGFAAFIATGNRILVEFGIVASINILAVFLLSLFLIPIFYSYLAPPEHKHIKHLDNKVTKIIIDRILWMVLRHRTAVYIITGVAVAVSIIGISQLKTTGRLVDDISEKDKLYKDMVFMQEQVNGILPFEIVIDTKKPRGVMRLSNLQKINRLQDSLSQYPEFSKPLSVAEVAKASRQAFYGGQDKFYSLPNQREKNFILSYLPGFGEDNTQKTILNSFMDSTMQKARISVQMANIGTNRIKAIKEDLRPKIDAVFNPDDYGVKLTGTTLVYLKGTDYMIKNLVQSLLLALVAIALLMALLFTSGKMVGVSLIPNLLPQLLTAALMGFLAISIKPSTILIFSIALGISVDNAIHFLSRYRMELKHHSWNIRIAVINALRETSYSMVYSSIVLFFGFAIFTLSSFGGTEALGYLVSFTLLIAVLANLFVLPSLILTLDKLITTRAFKKPMLEILETEENNNEEQDKRS
ncbi:MAG: efflux RND transporter permease subunit [Bacteroidota bacterium]